MEPPVIHRDIKPENIILSPTREFCLIDFDIARVYKNGQRADTVFMGTYCTAAPEQYGYAQSDERTDLYALGVTLRYMLTGSYEPEALERVDCPESLKRCLQKATAFSPDNRYQSAKEFRLALTGAESRRRLRWFLPAAVCAIAVISVAIIRQSGGTGGKADPASEEVQVGEQGQDISDAVQTGTDEPVAIYAPQITYFGMLGGLKDLEILKGLTNLEHLDLVGMENVSLEPLSELKFLRQISVNVCRGMDYSVLARIPSLEEVHAWDRQGLEEIEATCPDRNFELVALGSAKE